MIEFSLDTLRSVADATYPDMAYWRELFDSDAAETGTSYISLGVVAVVINAAIEAGVVQMPNSIDDYTTAYSKGYANGMQDVGSEFADLYPGLTVEAWQRYQEGLKPDPYPPSARAGDARLVTNSANGHHAEPDPEPAPIAATPLMADAPNFDYTPHPPSRPLVPRRHPYPGSPLGAARAGLPDADLCRDRLATALASATDEGETLTLTGEPGQALRAEIGVLEYTPNGALIDPGKKPRTMSQHGTALPTVTELIAKVQDLAMAGVMPSMSSFNLNKPSNWASATAHTERLGLSWSELAVQAGLTPNPCLPCKGLPGKAG